MTDNAARLGGRNLRYINPEAPAPPLPLQIRSQSVYLPDDAERESMIPGLIPIVFSLPVMAASLALARERETGSLESLVATPVRCLEYLGGKLIAYVTAALVGLLPVWLVATLLFGVPFQGSAVLLVVLAADFLLASVGMALFIEDGPAACKLDRRNLAILMHDLLGRPEGVDHHTFLNRLLDVFFPGGHLLFGPSVEYLDIPGPHSQGGSGHIDGDVSPAQNNDLPL